MRRAEQTGMIGFVADRDDVELDFLGFENDRGAADRELADAASRHAAARHQPLDLLPLFKLEKAPASSCAKLSIALWMTPAASESPAARS